VCIGYRVFPGRKVAEAWCWLPTPSIDEVKERVELYLYCPFRPLGRVLCWKHSILTYSVLRQVRNRF